MIFSSECVAPFLFTKKLPNLKVKNPFDENDESDAQLGVPTTSNYEM
jgi:hypothetical protein